MHASSAAQLAALAEMFVPASICLLLMFLTSSIIKGMHYILLLTESCFLQGLWLVTAGSGLQGKTQWQPNCFDPGAAASWSNGQAWQGICPTGWRPCRGSPVPRIALLSLLGPPAAGPSSQPSPPPIAPIMLKDRSGSCMRVHQYQSTWCFSSYNATSAEYMCAASVSRFDPYIVTLS